MKSYLIVSGVPGSGKSTVARTLAEDLGWPILDKDDYLEILFNNHGCRNSDQRQALSREADLHFQLAARTQDRAVLDSFWRTQASQSLSGTPTNWLVSSGIRVLEVVCRCSAETAAIRFLSRKRHPGHHDNRWTQDLLVEQSRQIERQLPLNVGEVIEYDSSSSVNLEQLFTLVRMWATA